MDEATTEDKPKPKRAKQKAPAGERAVRLPEELLERADKLVPSLMATPWGAIRWTETAVIRLAVARGLAALEDELATPPVTPKRKGKP